ncbi:MAG: peptide chain release factor N(5)-glutamine methyltransferase [Rhodocyclaceae bacterium]|nr:peptide chain release factor N(5)-glutamine methyltransferase [Rhodocyclaceae bacterium]
MPAAPEPTAGGLLAAARQLADAADVRLLLQHVLDLSHAQLIARPERRVTSAQAEQYSALVRRRAAGEPLAYLTGRREFYGLDLIVTPAVLIPRPETELLVDIALDVLRGHPAPLVLDLGTGSGAIALALGRALPAAHVVAVDRFAQALAVARQNAEQHAVAVEFLCSDWYAALGSRRFDAILANPPYVAAGDPHLSGEIRHEPVSALVSGADGLDDLRQIIAGAAQHLNPRGCIWVEHGCDQARAVRELFRAAGLADPVSWNDLAGLPRVSGASWSGAESRR